MKAHRVLAKTFDTKYPFAKSSLLTDGERVLFNGDMGNIIQADETLQINIKEAIESFCKKVEFNDDDLVKRCYPMGKDHSVVIDPKKTIRPTSDR